MTTTAVQSISQAGAAAAALQPQVSQPTQSFQKVLQSVQQEQQTKPAQGVSKPAQDTTKPTQGVTKPAAEETQPAENMSEAVQNGEQTPEMEEAGGILTQELTEETSGSGVKQLLMGLFGIAAQDVDETQSDMDILKDLLGKLRDPEQRFAVMLMMAFLQANPEYTLDDLAAQMPEMSKMPAVTGASPVNAVLNAITKLMEQDSNIQAFPLLQFAKQLVQTPAADRESVLMRQMQEMQAKVLSTPEQTQRVVSEGTQGRQSLQEEFLGQGRFREAIEQTRQTLASGTKQEKSTSFAEDVERLQQQVDAGVFLRGTNIFAAKALPVVPMANMPEFLTQVRTGIMSNLASAKSEFVMQLTPEGLGELTVKLAEIGGKMTLSIAASNIQTQRLLESQVSALREVMKPYDVEVTQIVGGKDDAAAKFGGEFGQQFGEHTHEQMEQHRGGTFTQVDDEALSAEEAVPEPVYAGMETLNTYI